MLFRKHTGHRLPKVIPLLEINDRRWNDPTPKIDWRLKQKLSKEDASLKVYAEYLSLVRRNYETHIKYFTDGSKAGDNVGFGLYGPDIRAAFRLPNCCSVFSAETAALKLAVETISTLAAPSVIFTDSASALKALQNGTSRHPWIQTIGRCSTTNITFCWIPGHKGITGNEEADRLAGLGRRSQRLNTKVPGADLKKHITSSIKQAWGIAWFNERELFLRKVKGTTDMWNDRRNRKEQQVLSRLRVGHTKITHAHYIGTSHNAPDCEICQCRLTVEHLLTSCPMYENYRTSSGLSGSIRDVLCNDSKAEETLLLFLRKSDLFDKI